MSDSKKFAPYELKSGWAEPFIGEMVMHHYGLSADLECVNGIPCCNAPKSVFNNESLPFYHFKERLMSHFQTGKGSPVMIDDGTYAMNIVGIGSNESTTTLWIADPHIKEGVNPKNIEKSNGLYLVTLNKTGAQISCSLDQEDHDQKAHLFSSGSYQGLHFQNKPWMVLFPNKE